MIDYFEEAKKLVRNNMAYPKLFKQEHFLIEGMANRELNADRAQSIFEEYLRKNGKVVYGTKLADKSREKYKQDHCAWWPEIDPANTHQALLINIQEIEKKDHKCQPKYLETNSDYENQMTCACGKKLRVKYEVVE